MHTCLFAFRKLGMTFLECVEEFSVYRTGAYKMHVANNAQNLEV
jgi:hypothetical protein